MTVIGFTNLKGGTGKTTSAVLVAEALLRAGRTVTVVDLDPQGSATEWAQMAVEAGDPLLFPITIGNKRTTKTLQETTEFTLLDCPPGNASIIDAAIRAADHLVVPVQPSSMEVQRVWDTLEITGTDKATVLLTSVIANTKAPDEVRDVLNEHDVDVFRGYIPRREEIRRWYGARPRGSLHGYESVAQQLVESVDV